MRQPVLHFVDCPGPQGKPAPHSVHQKAAGSLRQMGFWQWPAQDAARGSHVVVCAHGLTRQGRDFDVLAQRLCQHACVLCPDAAGRGHSDWLQTPADYHIFTYAADMAAMLQHRHRQTPIAALDWIGTSMGGLIGMLLAGHPALSAVLPAPIRCLVLNDVGPAIEPNSIARIANYLGKQMHFADENQAAKELTAISEGFGPHSEPAWQALTRPMLRPAAGGGVVLHYDAHIAAPFASAAAATPEAALAAKSGEEALWRCYDNIRARTLLVRGAQSDLLSRATAQAMTQRGPRAHCVEFDGVGHAPTFVAPGQVDVLEGFLFRHEALPHTLTLAAQQGGSREPPGAT